MTEQRVQCCIAGGGPAGLVLAYLLARAGVRVLVLEKHGDFLRDFRGDTIHPSTLEVLYELGLLDAFLALPHQEVLELAGQLGSRMVRIADFSALSTHCKFLALMPQWDFLNFFASEARRFPAFSLRMHTEATGLIEEGGRVVGVRAAGEEGPFEVRADLIVAADGRGSTLRSCADLHVDDLGAPMDVLWFRLTRRDSDPSQTLGRIEAGRMMVLINRAEHWQCAYVIAKGSLEVIRARGLDAFRAEVAHMAPFAADRLHEVASWDDVKLLTVRVDRLPRWYRPGLLCIGDAAHAMSPVGGVGINLAIQDAVAAANILAQPLREGRLATEDLQRVQRRRELPTRVTQRLQIAIQTRVIGRVLGDARPIEVPFIVRLLNRFKPLRRIPAWLIGIGIRPEHVRSHSAQ